MAPNMKQWHLTSKFCEGALPSRKELVVALRNSN